MKWVESIFTPFIMGSSLLVFHTITQLDLGCRKNATDLVEGLSQCAIIIF